MENIIDLVERAKRKEQSAITQLYMAAKDKALYIAKDMLKDEDEAQDVVQDAFIKAFNNLGSLEQPEKFQGWLDTIVINRCRDLLRRKRPMLFTELARDDGNETTLQWEDTNERFQPEANVDYAETRRLIKAMIDALPDPQRIATTLFYLEEMPVKDIAAFMSCSENTVKSRLNLARKNIKAQVLSLEKKGTKLYCAPLIPFLYWMYKQEIVAYAAVRGGVAVAGAAAAGTSAAGAGAAPAGATAAAGAGAAAAGTSAAGAGAMPAGATAAAAAKGAGMGIAVKAAAAAAVVAVTVTAAVAVSHFTSQKAVPVSISQEQSAPRPGSGAVWEGGSGRDVQTTASAVELSGEELAALKELYALKDSRDPDEFLKCIMVNRQLLYKLSDEKLDGGPYLFTGEAVERTDTGTGVYLKDPNTVYVGDLAAGVPHGNGNLGRWFWGYNTMAAQNCLSMGKAFSVLIGQSYQGGWSGGTAEGEGVSSQRGFPEYSGFDMGVYEQSGEESCMSDYYANTTIISDYVDGAAEGAVEFHKDESVYNFNTRKGILVMDEHVSQETKGKKTRYYVTSQDGEHKYRIMPQRVFNSSCTWNVKPSLKQNMALVPKGSLIQDWAHIEASEEIRNKIPFDDYPKFTADVLNYATAQGYITDLDILSESADGFIFLDGDPVTTNEYIQFHFYVDSVERDTYPEFDFRYYFNGNNAGGEAADSTSENQADADLINQVGTAALQQFIASTWDAATPDIYEEKVGIRLYFTGETATDGQKRKLVNRLSYYGGDSWNTGVEYVENHNIKLTREVYDAILASAIGVSDNTSSWEKYIADIKGELPELVGSNDSYLIYMPGDYGTEWPGATVENREFLGNGLYKVSGRVGYIAQEGETPEVPYEAVFKSNPGSMFMGLTLVTLTTKQ